MPDGAVNAALAYLGHKGIITGCSFCSMAATRLNEVRWSADAIEGQIAHSEFWSGIRCAMYTRAPRHTQNEHNRKMRAQADY